MQSPGGQFPWWHGGRFLLGVGIGDARQLVGPGVVYQQLAQSLL